MAICLTARLQVRLGVLARCEQTIREFVEAVKDESRTRLYTSVQETGEATRFLHFFIVQYVLLLDD